MLNGRQHGSFSAAFTFRRSFVGQMTDLPTTFSRVMVLPIMTGFFGTNGFLE
jgi:hypothetical protein